MYNRKTNDEIIFDLLTLSFSRGSVIRMWSPTPAPGTGFSAVHIDHLRAKLDPHADSLSTLALHIHAGFAAILWHS